MQANHGIRPWLNILGKPVGETLTEGRLTEQETGSIIVILATDAPLSALSLRQIAKRAAIGVGRGRSPGGNNSGDIFLAFSVANARPVPQKEDAVYARQELNSDLIDPLYLGAVQSVEEAVVNALVAGEDVATFKPKGHTCLGIDTDALKNMFC